MTKIEIFSEHPYYTQRNNRHDPVNACQRTAMVQGLICSGVAFDYPVQEQPEDYLWELGEDPEFRKLKFSDYPALAYTKDKAGNRIERPTLEIHQILALVTNQRLVKRDVVRFATSWKIYDLIFNLIRYRGAAVVSTNLFDGHVMSLVGVTTDQDDIEKVVLPQDIEVKKIKSVFVDDPYGDFRTNYKSQNGKGLEVPIERFIPMSKAVNRWDAKWAHLIRSEGWN